jgi:hypothetical protein
LSSLLTPEEFSRLLKALADDVTYAHIHWRMAKNLGASLKQYPAVEAQSRTFWYLTYKAHVTTALQHLARAFDQEQSSLHLLRWLKIIRDNLHIFEIEGFKDRLKENPYVQSLVDSASKPDPVVLAADIEACTDTDSLVRKLVTYRGSIAAHKSKKLALWPRAPDHSPMLDDADVEALLSRSRTILNRYSYMFSAEVHSTSITGQNDYKYIFTSVEESIAKSMQSRVI